MRGAPRAAAGGPGPGEPRLARVAAMIGDPTRARMLAHLLDGHYASAGELAAASGIGASAASAHLAQLQDNGLVVAEARGRHRYFKLADADVAHALEALALVAERGSHERRWQGAGPQGLRYARCCYGHLAGTLGVALKEALVQRGLLQAADPGYALSAAGVAWLAQQGIDLSPQRRRQRLAYGCIDWSERRDHLAGALAVTLLEHFLERGWLRRPPAAPGAPRSRALQLTPRGQRELLPLLNPGNVA